MNVKKIVWLTLLFTCVFSCNIAFYNPFLDEQTKENPDSTMTPESTGEPTSDPENTPDVSPEPTLELTEEPTIEPTPDTGHDTWMWVSGSDTGGQIGIYGTKGVAAAANMPGGRNYGIGWTDVSGNFWLFGGSGYDSLGNNGHLNDLWRFDGINWTWVSGSDLWCESGVYGTKGIVSGLNVPGARYGSISWIDTSDNLWLFGGYGYDSTSSKNNLNDLWRFDGTNWTWISGSDTGGQSGVYGTKGVASAANIPGARYGSISWIDVSDNLWLFGGYGYDSAGSNGHLNDLWRFDGTNWTWISGSDIWCQSGVYGSKGVASGSNIPGARYNAVSWIDASDNLWLFGGYGYDRTTTKYNLNDLWRFDGSNWTWISGNDTGGQIGIYGVKGAGSATNIPGARYGCSGWIDDSDTIWLFGGFGYDSEGNNGRLNDLWKFDGIDWTWMSGSDIRDQNGVYGTIGVPSGSVIPGTRYHPIAWLGENGAFYLFGGDGQDSIGNKDRLNDLFHYKP
ncbi:MAG: hypothetical protein JW881_11595 [Spirochaetales bacterium]|nr:hypothetical protein [Spirochaetales bacterium]